MVKKQIWYVRRKGQVKGPFPAGQISQFLVLGRIQADDEVSQDRETWVVVRQVRELIPDVLLAKPDDEMAVERLKAARRWADERRMDDGKSWEGGERRQRAGDRNLRTSENVVLPRTRIKPSTRIGIVALSILVMAGLVVLAFVLPSGQLVSVAQCEAPPAPGINWSYCRMSGAQFLQADLRNAEMTSVQLNGANLGGSNLQGADVSYADFSNAHLSLVNLSSANLKGANLRYADLSDADLRNADLSYADLTHARLDGINLAGAQLDFAIWVDGNTCAPGSVGRCVAVRRE
ncbi:MAG TPA: pentapeptide repeat-containing protein [Gammaproteobacteria bacterium]|nr:pentapeptide repeat-containing protein [Gammaproteobacteria bacterium]